jgi:hypothetical protein
LVFTRKGHRIVSIYEVKNDLFALNKRVLIVGSLEPEFTELTVNFPLLQERKVSNIGCFNYCRREFPDGSAADGVVTGCIQALSLSLSLLRDQQKKLIQKAARYYNATIFVTGVICANNLMLKSFMSTPFRPSRCDVNSPFNRTAYCLFGRTE